MYFKFVNIIIYFLALDCGSLNTLETVEEGAEGVLASLVNVSDVHVIH